MSPNPPNVRLFILRRQWSQRFNRWLGHLPTQCAICRKIIQRKEGKRTQHRAAGDVTVCQECFDSLYHPFRARFVKLRKH